MGNMKCLGLVCWVLWCGCQTDAANERSPGVDAPAGTGAVSGVGGAGGVAGTDDSIAGSSGTGGAAGTIAVDAGTPPRGELITLKITIPAVAPDGQDHACVTLATPNESVAWVKSIHATLNQGSHHLIVDRAAPGSALNEAPMPCPPTMGGDVTRLIIAQQHDTRLDTPEGTAFRIEPHQPIFMQMHYFNFSGAPITIEGVVELELADAESAPPIEVQSLFTGQMFISLAAGPGMAEFFYTPPGSAQKPAQVFALTSHTHSLGVRSTIERVANATAPDSPPIHEALDWEEPPLDVFDPPLAFTGADGVRLRCYYDNTTDRIVTFGTRAEDEMCFMWLYYY